MTSHAPRRRLRVLVTGSAGVIGRVLVAGLAHDIVEFDRPEHDALDPDDLRGAMAGCDGVVHLAWDMVTENFRNRVFVPDNLRMSKAVLDTAADLRLSRAVLASSVHADGFWPPHEHGRLDPALTPTPDSPYGVSKVWLEAYGRYIARHRGLGVVAIRFGGVNARDSRPPEPGEKAVWLRHRDCVSLVDAALTQPLRAGNYALVVGVSDNPTRLHEFGDELAWRPSSRPNRPP